MTLTVGEQVTNSPQIGKQVTNSPLVSEEVTNSPDVSEEVTNSPDVSEEVTKSSVVVANCDDIGESIANSVDADTPGSKVIVPQVNGNGECASSSLGIGDIATNSVSDTTRTTRRRLDMASENTGAVKTPIILLNPASNPAGRPKEKKATTKSQGAQRASRNQDPFEAVDNCWRHNTYNAS
ncbi:hypothetical protein GN958_ATG16996 [Phytophthora infestans]|uniref:Uncharacterized protein n=1 Tax=Phytophthora infestans TaxID=4787 RepID=A0A8S9U3C4_PHYIN|nr:hypothetical protein GN958_ATG16996 [Phytophthora infestans]